MNVIAFTGRKGSGKDTAAALFEGIGYERYAFADPLKATVGALFGLSHEQLHGALKETPAEPWGYTPRELLQVFGTEIVREGLSTHLPRIDGTSFWVDRFRHWYARERRSQYVVVTDVRFPNEAAAIKEMGGTVIRIERPGLVANGFSDHASETAIDAVPVDGVVYNDGGIAQLHTKLRRVWLGLDE